MNYTAEEFYSYYKECYKLDYKEFKVDNILAQKYHFKWFASGNEELIHEELPIIPYPNKKAEDLAKEVELYKLEKKLFYGCFFILGKSDNAFVKDKRVCAPLILFPATIQNIDDEHYLDIDRNSFVLNRAVIAKLDPKSDAASKDQFFEELSERINEDRSNLIGLKSLFEKYFPSLDSDEILLFPEVWSAQKIRKHLSETTYQEGEFKIVPAAGTLLIEKSESSLKVISDLSQMALKSSFNNGLKALLSDGHTRHSSATSFLKSRLNTDQYKALQNAHQFDNSVIIGPPGTGKSYTITAIIADAVLKNQSVLVVSKTKQAVEVIRSMLENEYKLKDYLVHTTGARYKQSLSAKLSRYLSGMFEREVLGSNKARVSELFKKLSDLENKFEALIEKELSLSDLGFSHTLNLIEKWRKFYLSTTLYDSNKIWVLFEAIENTTQQLEKEINSYLKKKVQSNIHKNVKTFRKDLSLFYDALDSASFTRHKEIMEDVQQSNILKVFPIWLAHLSDLNSILPLEADLFDLVIIDEATQCDIASALPALYRAKRSIIVGDPNQLKHYSFVSGAQQENLRKNYNLPKDAIFDYRNRSILDLYISKVQNQEQVSFLREHYRSTPSLIEFSNQQFYDGQLAVLKSTPKHSKNKQIELIELSGFRDEKGVNQIEADALLEKLTLLMEEYSAEKIAPSIGIISPFNSQVKYINALLKERFSLEQFKKFDLLCGTPYNFQGSEREIIFISFCLSNTTHPSAFVHANQAEVLNVAITRAKSFQYIFKSVSDVHLKQDSLLYQYFSFIRAFSQSNQEEPELDNFQREVVASLAKIKDYQIHCGYPLAGSLLDILITKGSKSYFIDLIGYPGMFKEAFPIERYKTLARIGIKSLPLNFRYWQKDKTAVLKTIKRFII